MLTIILPLALSEPEYIFMYSVAKMDTHSAFLE